MLSFVSISFSNKLGIAMSLNYANVFLHMVIWLECNIGGWSTSISYTDIFPIQHCYGPSLTSSLTAAVANTTTFATTTITTTTSFSLCLFSMYCYSMRNHDTGIMFIWMFIYILVSREATFGQRFFFSHSSSSGNWNNNNLHHNCSRSHKKHTQRTHTIFIALRNVELISIQLSAHTLPTPRFILGFLIPMLFFRCFAVKFPYYPIWFVGVFFALIPHSRRLILTRFLLHPFYFNQFLLYRISFYTFRVFFPMLFVYSSLSLNASRFEHSKQKIVQELRLHFYWTIQQLH